MTRIITVIFCMLFFAAQAQEKNTFIKAAIKGLEAGRKVYLKTGNVIVDSTVTKAGGFRLDLAIPEGKGSSYCLLLGRPEYTGTTLWLYLEKGTVTITGNGPLFTDVVLSGPSFIDDLNDYNRSIQATDDRLKEVWKKAQTAREQKDQAAVSEMSRQAIFNDSIKNALTTQWIGMHPASPVSVYLLSSLFYYNRNINIQEGPFKKLLPVAKNNLLAKKLQEQVMANDLNGIGKTAPDLAKPDTLDKMVSLKDLRGKYVLIDFWASWCHPCREETPYLREAIQQYGEKGFIIMSVSIDKDKEKWLAAVRKDQMAWVNVLDPATNRADGILDGYYTPTVPTNLLIDPRGIIIARNLRGKALGKKLSEIF